jgi:4-hydroxythreonine-4-phosphate dehydrogenase
MKKPKPKTRILITIGDVNGIGPEIILKSLKHKYISSGYDITVISPASVIEYYSKLLGININRLKFKLIDFPDIKPEIKPGKVNSESGRISASAISLAAELCMNGYFNALVTAPISKKSFENAGVKYDGHTEMLEHLSGSSGTCMMMLSDKLRLALVTNHPPLRMISKMISAQSVFNKLETCLNALRKDLNIKYPKIAVLGLNPHAGDEGKLGDEEITVIIPAIKAFKRKHKKVIIEGPFSSDSYFAAGRYKDFDLTLAMYHDQGLIAFKMISAYRGINFTAGLTFVRTSPDHGTAFDIAGKNTADETSMVQAIKFADLIHKNRIN